MSMIIRKGTAEDLDAVEKLYGEVCGHMAATVNYCGWKRDVYPARQDAEAGIREGTLFLVRRSRAPGRCGWTYTRGTSRPYGCMNPPGSDMWTPSAWGWRKSDWTGSGCMKSCWDKRLTKRSS